MRRDTASFVLDMGAVLPGWLVAASLDPFLATCLGLPIGAVLMAVRRTAWRSSPIAGRLAAFLLFPTLLAPLAAAFAFGVNGLVLGLAGATALVGLAEILRRAAGRTFVAGSPLAVAVAFAALTAALGGLCMEARLAPYPTEEAIKRFAKPPEPPVWSGEAKREAVAAARRVVDRGAVDEAALGGLYDDLKEELCALVDAPAPDGVFVTLYEASGYRSRGFGARGADALQSVIRAAANAAAEPPRMPRRKGARPRMWDSPLVATHVQIDVPGARRSTAVRPLLCLLAPSLRGLDDGLARLGHLGRLLELTAEVEPGVDGLAVRRAGANARTVILPAEVVTSGWATPRVRSTPATIAEMLRRALGGGEGGVDLASADLEVARFRTRSFGEPRAGLPIVDWYRGNALLPAKLDRALLAARTDLAADWLARQVVTGDALPFQKKALEPGRFRYETMPPYRSETRDYSLPRHSGAVYGLFAFHRASLERRELAATGSRALAAGLAALAYVEQNLRAPGQGSGQELCFLEEGGRTISGSTALAAVALVALAPAKKVADGALRQRVAAVPVERYLEGMGACLLGMIDPDGAVFESWSEARRHARVKAEPLYYPGEVLLALVRSAERLGDARLLAGARRIADRQLGEYRWMLALDIPATGDHWMIQGLSDLARLTGERRYAELAVLMGRGYLREQYPPQAHLYPDYRGSYRRLGDVPRTTRAASRGEALGAAMDAARFLGESPADFADALIEGARHLAEQQLVVENTPFVPQGFDVQGAIRMGLIDNHCRIDNNQHGLVAMLRALDAMDFRDGKR